MQKPIELIRLTR